VKEFQASNDYFQDAAARQKLQVLLEATKSVLHREAQGKIYLDASPR
jgi:hypothetical protein